MRFGEGPASAEVVGNHERIPYLLNGKGTDIGRLADIVTPSAQVERAGEGRRAFEDPAPVFPDAEFDKGGRFARNIAVGGAAAGFRGWR